VPPCHPIAEPCHASLRCLFDLLSPAARAWPTPAHTIRSAAVGGQPAAVALTSCVHPCSFCPHIPGTQVCARGRTCLLMKS